MIIRQKMISLLKLSIVFALIQIGTSLQCPLVEQPDRVFECVGYVSRALYGAAIQG